MANSGISFTPTGLLIGGGDADASQNANVVVDASSATDAFGLPVGTTSQRPNGQPGFIRFNKTTQSYEGFIAAWSPLGGGQLSVQNNNTLVNTTSVLNFANTSSVKIEALDDTANGRVTIQLTAQGGAGTINVQNNGVTYTNSAVNLNFNTTSTVNVAVLGQPDTANISFTANQTALVGTAWNTANAAYAQANTAYNAANTAEADAQAAIVIAENAYAEANAAYGQANSAFAEANAAFALATTAENNALNAYAQANAAYGQANSAYSQANSAANTVATFNNGTLILAAANLNFNNTVTINVASGANGTTQSNVAFNANLSSIVGPTAANANAAYNQANAAYAQANLAYTQANTDNTNFWTQNILEAEPTGFINRTNSSIAFNVSTRTFSISPNANSTFNVYVNGTVFTKNAADTFTIANVTGGTLLYYDSTGSLQNVFLGTGTTDIAPYVQGNAFVSFVYWNANVANTIIFTEERHGLTMDWATVLHLHRSVGTQYYSGLGIQNFTTAGTGSSNADASVGFANGVIADEDLIHNITDGSPQTISANALIPVLYQTGNVGTWVRDNPTAYPVKTGTSLITYNLLTGNTYTTPDATTNDYVAMWILATNDVNYKLMAILGQRKDGSLKSAQDNNLYTSLDLTGLPFQEFRPIYRLIFQTSSGMSNAVKAALVDVLDVRNVAIASVSVATGLVQNSQITIQNNNSTVNGTSILNFVSSNTVNTSVVQDSTNTKINVAFSVNVSSFSTVIYDESFTANANQTVFTLTNGLAPSNVNYVLVTRNGLLLKPTTHYTLSGQTLTLTSNTLANDIIDVREFIGANIVQPSVILTEQFTANANQSVFVLNNVLSPSNANYILVHVNGLEQSPVTGYTISGNTLTLTSNASNNDIIEVREFIGANIANGGFAAGQNTQIQFNLNGSLAGDANLTFNTATGFMGIGVSGTPNTSLHIVGGDEKIRLQRANANSIAYQSYYNQNNVRLGYNGLASGGSNSYYIYTETTDGAIIFGANSTEKLRINANGIVFATGSSAVNSLLIPSADQTLYSLLGRAQAGPGIQARWDSSTGNRYIVIGTYDNAGVWTETLKVVNGGTVTSNTGFFATNTRPSVDSANGGMTIGGDTSTAQMFWINSAAGANLKMWDCFTNNGVMNFRLVNDLNSAASNWLQINRTQHTAATVAFPLVTTTASGTTAVFDAGNNLLKSSSSIRYKVNVETLWANVAYKALDLRPIWYRSNTDICTDPEEYSYIGLLAEEVANIEPRLVTYSRTDASDANSSLQIEGVKYDRLAVMLLAIVKDQQSRIEALETKIKTRD